MPRASGPVCYSTVLINTVFPISIIHAVLIALGPSCCQHSASPHRLLGLFYGTSALLPAADGLRIMPMVAGMCFPCVALV